jgi:hypothetical protein
MYLKVFVNNMRPGSRFDILHFAVQALAAIVTCFLHSDNRVIHIGGGGGRCFSWRQPRKNCTLFPISKISHRGVQNVYKRLVLAKWQILKMVLLEREPREKYRIFYILKIRHRGV